jgi:dephospho-CoA kinase
MTKKGPFIIGLTGSIGMGKTTTAAMFADLGIPVWDADQAVAKLYAKGGGAANAIFEIYPKASVGGVVNKAALRDWITKDTLALAKIEAVVHPLVAMDRKQFLEKTEATIVVLDIPLLFETGADAGMDMVVVVSAPPEIQRDRVLERSDMNENQFETLLSSQMPDAEKRARADIVIKTSTLDGARKAVQELVTEVRDNLKNA